MEMQMTLDEMYAEDQRLVAEINKLTAQRYELAKKIVAAENEFNRRR
jgi:hypothetical protein